MKTKQKAEEMIDNLRMDNTAEGYRRGVKCAIICVDEILDTGALQDYNSSNLPNNSTHRIYWENVREELEFLKD
jgi:hypothetical protein